VVPKIEALHRLRETQGYGFEIEVDGGVTVETAPLAARAGADILVAGAAVFKSEDPAEAVRSIHESALRGRRPSHS
jgi:ribulose-phosphate 3-epimerase